MSRKARRPSLFSRHRTSEFQETRERTKEELIQIALDDTRNAIRTNMETLIARGEILDTMETTVVELGEQSQFLRKQATELKQEVRWQLQRRWIIVGVVVLLAALALVGYILFATCNNSFHFAACFGSSSNSTSASPSFSTPPSGMNTVRFV